MSNYLGKTDASEEIPSWNDLKRIYKKSIRGNNGPPTRVRSNAQDATYKIQTKVFIIRAKVFHVSKTQRGHLAEDALGKVD